MLRKAVHVHRADDDPATLARPAAGVAHPLLQLQRQAGNAAVVALVQRDAPAEGTAERTTVSANFGELGAVPVASYRVVPPRGGTGKSAQPHDIAIVVPIGPYSPDLESAAARGKVYSTVDIDGPGLHIALSEVLISSAATSGGGADSPAVMELTLTASKVSSQ